MNLDLNDSKFSIKYAIMYTIAIFIILIVPFAIYDKYRYTLEEVKTEIALKKKAIEIINEMEKFNPKIDGYFTFPRYKRFYSGLYDSSANPIFTLIDSKITSLNLKPGYNKFGKNRLYVVKFDDKRYFGATYLVIETKFDIYAVLQNILLIFLLILIVTFLFSFTILRNFAKPFKQMNETLDEFIKDAMHEINTPLSIININIDLFSEKFGKNKYLNRIKSASKILSTIYNDMNYLIKEQTITSSKRARIDFSLTLKKSVDYFIDIAELKDIELITEIEEGIMIDFIPAKLQKIIDNNLSNAIKYSHEDSKVILSLKRVGGKIVLGFRDFGIGIKEPDMIFSRYYRENNAKGGFGIGLNIVKKIIDEENIGVKIESKLGDGSYFEYTFNELKG